MGGGWPAWPRLPTIAASPACFCSPTRCTVRASRQLRTEHWPRIRCPVLIVQGESDPSGSPDELRCEARKLRDVRVVTLPGTGHALKERLDDAMAAAADWIRSLG